MDQQELYAWERRCIQEEMPYCRAACPLQVDARAFMERMAAADLPGGRKILERHMPLPGLLGRVCDHPCETRCLRGEFGGSLAIGALERLCVSRTPRQTRPLPIPRKNKSVAVVGDGFAGLTVAWDLGRKGYAVAVFHPEAAVGAALLSRLGVDDASVLEDELAVIRRGAVTFTPRALDIALVDEARASFDAVFVDAESAPHLARLRADLDPVTLLEPEPLSEGRAALCYGGWLEGDSVVNRAAEGRRAAATLERFVTGVSLTAARERRPHRHPSVDARGRSGARGPYRTRKRRLRRRQRPVRSRPLSALRVHGLRARMRLYAALQRLSQGFRPSDLQQRGYRQGAAPGQQPDQRVQPVRPVRSRLPRRFFHGRSLSGRPAGDGGTRIYAALGSRVCSGRYGRGRRPGMRACGGQCRRGRP